MGYKALALLYKKKKHIRGSALPKTAQMGWLDPPRSPFIISAWQTRPPFFHSCPIVGGDAFSWPSFTRKRLHFSAERNVEESFRMKGKIRKATYSIKLKSSSSRGGRPFAIWVHRERCLYSSPIPASRSASERGAEEQSLRYTPNALLLPAHCYRPSE